MATRIDMPQLGLTMETGTILQWLKAVGDTVREGQPVVLIQTDKVEYEVESPAAGTLLKVVVQEGAELPVGSLMAVIGEAGEDVSSLLGRRPWAGRADRAKSHEPRAALEESRTRSRGPRAGRCGPGERVRSRR